MDVYIYIKSDLFGLCRNLVEFGEIMNRNEATQMTGWQNETWMSCMACWPWDDGVFVAREAVLDAGDVDGVDFVVSERWIYVYSRKQAWRRCLCFWDYWRLRYVDEVLAVAKFSLILGIRACNRNTEFHNSNPYHVALTAR